jgi:para-aminobenzoate synthetase component 1
MTSSVPPAEARVERLPWQGDPLDLLRRAAGRQHPFLLLSGGPPGRWTVMGWEPFHVWTPAPGEDPFRALAALAARTPVHPCPPLPFVGGLVGFLGYECLRFVEDVPVREPGELPMAWFAAYGAALVHDGSSGELHAVATGWPEAGGAARARRAARQLEAMRRLAAGTPTAVAGAVGAGTGLRSSLPRPAYLRAVGRILEHIRRGDIYQANLTQRIVLDLPEPAPIPTFCRLQRCSRAPHAAFLDGGTWQLLSASPERFVALVGDEAESRPIKGTIRRGPDPRRDRELREALRGSPKDRAENVMIVDLVRNDLHRVCVPGTVHVPALAEAETYATLHHLVSTVRGRLAPSHGVADLLRALFPPGSMTGAPKIRAMAILHRLEPVARGPYAGGLGYLSFDGRLDLSVVIRTILLQGSTARFHVGGGVVAESEPESEYEESLLKARALLQVLGGDAAVAGEPAPSHP